MINQYLNKPYNLVWWSIPIILLLSITGYKGAIDIQMHDTYFVIASIHIGILLSILLGIIGFIYWLVRKTRLVNWMTVSHLACTILAFFLTVLISLTFKETIEANHKTFSTLNQMLAIIILIALSSQLIFLINLAYSLLRNRRHNKS